MQPRANNSASVNDYRSSARAERPEPVAEAVKYYVISTAIAFAIFAVVWAVLFDIGDDTPILIAIFSAGVFFASAAFFREVVLRNSRERQRNVKRLDRSVRKSIRIADISDKKRLTLDQNTKILRKIQQKSDAAKVLEKLSEAHREVADLCEEYLAIVAAQIPSARVGSPRIPALMKGSELVKKCHHFHLLKWAAIESRNLTNESKTREKVSEKLDTGNRALEVIEFALKSYPNDISLRESRRVLLDYLSSIRVNHSMELAERSHFKGNHKRAIVHYKEALFDLNRNYSQNKDREIIGAKILSEIQRLKQMTERG